MKQDVNNDFSVSSDISNDIYKLFVKNVIIYCERNDYYEENIYKSTIDDILSITYCGIYGKITKVNDRICHILKYSEEDLVGKSQSILNSGLHSDEFFDDIKNAAAANKVWRGEVCNRAKDGSLFWFDTTIAPRRDADGNVCGFLALRLDITARKDAEARAEIENQKRRDAEVLLNEIVDTLPNGVIAYDPDGKVIFFNRAIKKIYGQVLCELAIGKHRNDIGNIALREGVVEVSSRPREPSDSTEFAQLRLLKLPDDRWIQVQCTMSPRGTQVSVQTDVSNLKRAEQEIAQLAYSDPVTGILNRHAMLERLTELCVSPDLRHRAALVVIDLNGFKAINDSMGHGAGDAMLRHVAQTLKSSVRQGDGVARIGGDEFAVLLHGVEKLADVRRLMAGLASALAAPARIGKQTVASGVSMGVAMFPGDGATPEELMRNADIAMYENRRLGRGYTIYSAKMQKQHMRSRFLADRMRQALADDEFQVALQPQWDMVRGCHCGFEALARWKVGDTWIPPTEFIAAAEEGGLIIDLSYRIIDKALTKLASLKRMGLDPGMLGINVVAAQLHDPKFPKTFQRLLAKHGVSPEEIEIEITENVMLDRSSKNIEHVLSDLHAKGVSIALDDFGTGYASLTHLRRFPLDRLKIDRSFVNDLLHDKDDYAIVCATISLGHSLGLKVVAEGIETQAQYEELCKLGCDYAQGYLISRPQVEKSTLDYLKRSAPAGAPPRRE